MSEIAQQPAAIADIEKKEEEAPALPTTEPPKEETITPPAVPVASEEPAAAVSEKKEEKKEEQKKEPEPPKDIREDPIGWLQQQIPPAVHIVNYHVLDWAQKFAVDDETARQPLPGKNGAVTRNQFLNFLKDGTLLAQIAKKFGAPIEAIHEGEAVKNNKENQTANIQAFADWAKANLGLPEDQVLSVADLQEKGKAGYTHVFNTIWQAGSQAVEKFGATTGIDVDQVATTAGAAIPKNISQRIQSILNFFKRARPQPQLEKKAALEAEEAAKKDATAVAENVEEVVEEECKKTESAPVTAAPIVEAN